MAGWCSPMSKRPRPGAGGASSGDAGIGLAPFLVFGLVQALLTALVGVPAAVLMGLASSRAPWAVWALAALLAAVLAVSLALFEVAGVWMVSQSSRNFARALGAALRYLREQARPAGGALRGGAGRTGPGARALLLGPVAASALGRVAAGAGGATGVHSYPAGCAATAPERVCSTNAFADRPVSPQPSRRRALRSHPNGLWRLPVNRIASLSNPHICASASPRPLDTRSRQNYSSLHPAQKCGILSR